MGDLFLGYLTTNGINITMLLLYIVFAMYMQWRQNVNMCQLQTFYCRGYFATLNPNRRANSSTKQKREWKNNKKKILQAVLIFLLQYSIHPHIPTVTMSIFTRSFPSIKQLQKNIAHELLQYENATAKSLAKAELEKTKTYYNYLKRVKLSKGEMNDIKDIDTKLDDLTKKTCQDKVELQDKTSFNGIIDKVANEKLPEEYGQNNLNNVHLYLKNQREYFDLLTRYNPGLLMSQSDNVSKTANRVGLEVPN